MKKLFLLAAILTLPLLVSAVPVAFAATPAPPAEQPTNCTNTTPTINTDPKTGHTTDVYTRQCDPAVNQNQCNSTNLNAGNCDLIRNFIQQAFDFMTVLFGIGVVVSMIYGGIEYASSAGDPSKAAAGKNRIRNALVALVTYVFLWALLDFLIPGGLA